MICSMDAERTRNGFSQEYRMPYQFSAINPCGQAESSENIPFYHVYMRFS